MYFCLLGNYINGDAFSSQGTEAVGKSVEIHGGRSRKGTFLKYLSHFGVEGLLAIVCSSVGRPEDCRCFRGRASPGGMVYIW